LAAQVEKWGFVRFDQPLQTYPERCFQRSRELDVRLDQLIAVCRSLPDVRRLIVFGSYARERVSPWSDLDVLVVRDGGPPDLVDDIYRLSGGGDIVGIRSSDFPKRLMATPFGRTILEQGREVYARGA
jgi:predicted nucleotidyltransferase